MIKAEHVFKSYISGKVKTEVLKDVSVSFDGGMSVILGASGSGKSTLLSILSGLERPDGGSIEVDGVNLAALTEKELTAFRRKKVGFVFQQYFLLPHLNVEKNVRLGADLGGTSDYESIIEAVGLSDKRRRYPAELSGGEQQRVSIARAIAKNPEYLFLDEPTGALDEATGISVMEYLTRLQRERGFTAIMVTHNEAFTRYADRVLRMNSGKIVGERV